MNRRISLTTTSYLAGYWPRNKLSRVGGWLGGWVGGIGNKAQLSPARAGTGAWPELGNSHYIPHGFAQRDHYHSPTLQNLIGITLKTNILFGQIYLTAKSA